jgi:hypothetical protein
MASSNFTDRLLDAKSGFLKDTRTTPVVDAFVGGQNGPMLNIGRYLNNSAYVSRPSISRVVEFPRWVDYMPNPEVFQRGLKNWFEIQSKFEGLQKGIQVDMVEQEIGPAGVRQFDVNKATITQSDITHSAMDKVGLPFQNLHTIWIRYGMVDPETMIPLVHLLKDDIGDHLPDMWSATVLYFEPDIRQRSIQKAWLCTNMGPRNAGPDEGRRDLQSAGSPLELSIPYTSLQDTSMGAMNFALSELKKMNRRGLNPLTRQAFVTAIDADVAKTAAGYFEAAEDAAKKQATTV